MNADEFKKLSTKFLAPRLREKGWKGSGFNFYRTTENNIIQILGIQGSWHGGLVCCETAIHFDFIPDLAGKTDPSKVLVRDLSKTNNCYLAKQIRKRLKKEGITKGFRCVFSTEIQKEESLKLTDGSNFKKSFYGTISFMPALFGLNAAAEVINYLLKEPSKKNQEQN